MASNPSAVDRSSWLSSVPKIPLSTTPTRLSSVVAPLSLTPRTTTSRGERLASSLRRGYISARVLHTRAGPSVLAEFLGPLAPERYLSLPRKSPAAAKALTAVALRKGLKEVTRLETFRRSGSVREGARAVKNDEDLGDLGWFDGVAAAMLGENIGGGVSEILQPLTTLRLGPNADAGLRTAHLPLETFRVEMTAGIDFSHSIAPAMHVSRSGGHGANNASPNSSKEIEPVPATPDESAQEKRMSQLEGGKGDPSVSDVIEAALPDVIEIDAVQPVAQSQPNAAPADGSLMPTQLVFDQIFDDVSASLGANSVLDAANGGAQDISPPLHGSIHKSDVNEIAKNSVAPNEFSRPVASPAKGSVEVRPVLFAKNGSSRVCFDIDIVDPKSSKLQAQESSAQISPFVKVSNGSARIEQKKPIEQKQPQVFVQAANSKKLVDNKDNVTKVASPHDISAADSRMEVVGVSDVACNVRQDAPTTMLQEMLEDLNHDSVPAQVAKNEPHRNHASKEVVNIDADDEDEQLASQQPTSRSKRSRKRRLSNVALHEKQGIEERRDRMRTTVVATLQDSDVKKIKSTRPNLSLANGSRSPHPHDNSGKTRKLMQMARAYPKRSNRRSRKSSTPIIDSSDSDDNMLDQDEDFVLQEGQGSSELPNRSTNLRHARHSAAQVPGADDHSSLSAIDKRERHNETRKSELVEAKEEKLLLLKAKTKPKLNALTQERRKKPWEVEINRLERLVDCSESGSPNIFSAEEESDLEPHGGLPLVERLVNWHLQNGRCLLDSESFDEHGEMMQFYKETRNEPPYKPAGGGSPGTAFVLESWRQHVRPSHAPNTEKVKEEQKKGGKPGNGPPAAERNRADASKTPTPSKESSDGSSARSDSSDGEDAADEGETYRMQLKAKAVRARELQNRVCGDLISNMEPEAKRRVLRWAEKDFSWFDDGADMMEIVGSRSMTPCAQCESIDGSNVVGCEESILLKLWTNMTWRKVRRMRHRARGGPSSQFT